MPKIKTHRGTKKRVKRTGGGKLLRATAFGNHNFERKRPDRKRRFAQIVGFSDADRPNIKKLLGRK